MTYNSSTSLRRGFALLIAVAISGVLISVAYSMFRLALKQTELNATGKDSQTVFFAADSGVECALRYDYKVEQAFVTIDYSGSQLKLGLPAPATPFYCMVEQAANPKIPILVTSSKGGVVRGQSYSEDKAITSTFVASSSVTGMVDWCAQVTVVKYLDNTDTLKTYIASTGYNMRLIYGSPADKVCGAKATVQRGIEVDY